jgi:putative transposase
VLALYWIFLNIEWIVSWMLTLIYSAADNTENDFKRLSLLVESDHDHLNINDEVRVITIGFKYRKKPQWVIDEIIKLKAINPGLTVRKLMETFNRLYCEKRQMTVGRTFVGKTLQRHQYEIEVLRKKIKNRRPAKVAKNLCWGVDLTYVTTESKEQLPVIGMIDYGSRKNVCLQHIQSKHSIVLIGELLKAIIQYGKPKTIKTDNERVFTSALFTTFLFLFGIKHQKSDVAAPWQNGRIERFFATFKEKVRQIAITNGDDLTQKLAEFNFWYNAVRSHSYLDGKTPDEVWNNVDVFTQGYKRAIWYEKWDGLLTGYYLKT